VKFDISGWQWCRAVPEVVNQQPFTAEVRVRYQACPYGTYGKQSGTRVGIFPSISIFAYQYYSPKPSAQWLSFQRQYVVLTGDTDFITLRTAVGSSDATPVVRVLFFFFCLIETCFSRSAMSSYSVLSNFFKYTPKFHFKYWLPSVYMKMQLVLSANAVVPNLRAGFPWGDAAFYAKSLQTHYAHSVDWRNNMSCSSATVRQMF
jgi:hypothetical protein